MLSRLPLDRLLTLGLPPRLPEDRLLTPGLLPRLPAPPEARLLALGMLPPCRLTCWRALAWRVDRESPRAVPPYLFAVARLE